MVTVSTASGIPVGRPARVGAELPGASSATVVVFLVAGALLPWAANDYWTFNVTVGLVLAVSCLGLQVLGGWARQISLMQAGLTGAAAHLDGHLFGSSGTSGVRHHYLYSAVVTIAFSVAVSVAVAVLGARRPLMYPLVATFAIQFLFDDTLFRPAPLIAGLSSPLQTPRQFLNLNLDTDRRYYLLVFPVLLVVLAGVHRLRHSRLGRAMIAVGNDPVGAAVSGVSVTRARAGAFAVAGLLAGVAGVLSAPLYGDPGTYGWRSSQSLVYVAVAVIAGSRSARRWSSSRLRRPLLPVRCRGEFRVNIIALPHLELAMLVVLLLQPLGLGRLASSLRGDELAGSPSSHTPVADAGRAHRTAPCAAHRQRARRPVADLGRARVVGRPTAR